MLRVVTDEAGRDDARILLDEIVAEGARRMLPAALETSVIPTNVSGLVGEVDEHGHRMVVRNGRAVGRSIVTGAGRSWWRQPNG